MTKEEMLEILKLLSNLESVIDMDMFRKQVPDWLIARLEMCVGNLEIKIKGDTND
jgi:hypothetical protein